jgi:hypothetical protein
VRLAHGTDTETDREGRAQLSFALPADAGAVVAGGSTQHQNPPRRVARTVTVSFEAGDKVIVVATE